MADRFAIPDALYREGVRRYGFHGLSYEYIAGALAERVPEIALGRIVVAHLGSGASMCALAGGRSVDSSMGFTALDGLPMGTRPGSIDAGVILWLQQQKGWDVDRVERFLYADCGLKGLSGVSNDMRTLLASDAPLAKLAVEYFVYHVARTAGALAAAMGGIDGMVFTAGIGERSPEIRARVLHQLHWLGFSIDEAANQAGGPLLTRADSPLPAYVIPTDEELVIARHTLGLVGAATHHARTDAEALAESPIERGEAVETPGVGDVGDGPGSARWAFQYRAAFFQPPAQHMLRKAGPCRLEQEMQLPNRDLHRGSHPCRGQIRLRQMERYIVLHLSQFCSPGCGALVARTAAAGQREKAAKVVDDPRQFGAVALVDRIVQGMQISLHQPVDAV